MLSDWGCIRYAEEAALIVESELSRLGCDCVLLSGGVDTSFIAVSHSLLDKGFELGIVASPWTGGDYEYASRLGNALNLKLKHVEPSAVSSQTALDYALPLIETADPVEASSAMALALSLAYAKSEGCRCVASGDGGDELLLGYGFLLRKSPEELKAWRDKMIGGGARFTIKVLSSSLGVDVAMPLYTLEFREYSRSLPLRCLINGGPDGKLYGKYLLRLYLHHAGYPWLAWRPKTPVTHGSGALKALEELAMGATPLEGWEPSAPHSFLVKRLQSLKALRPPCGDHNRACPVCGRCMDGSWCSFCGASLTSEGLSVYGSDQEVRGRIVMHYEEEANR